MPKIVCYSRRLAARLNLIEGIWDAICKINDIISMTNDIRFVEYEVLGYSNKFDFDLKQAVILA